MGQSLPGFCDMAPIWKACCIWACRPAEALVFVHARGICHRDLKPSNVLLTADGKPMLLDFNQSSPTSVSKSEPGGTLPYMASEQLQVLLDGDGSTTVVDERRTRCPRAVLHELLTGMPPCGHLSSKTPLSQQRCQTLLEDSASGYDSLSLLHKGRARRKNYCPLFAI